MTGIQAFDDTPSMESQFGEPAMTSPAEGWQLVPKVPTDDMDFAGGQEVDSTNPYVRDVAINVWAAMLAASPHPAPGPAGDLIEPVAWRSAYPEEPNAGVFIAATVSSMVMEDWQRFGRIVEALVPASALAACQAKVGELEARVIPAETRVVELEHRLLELQEERGLITAELIGVKERIAVLRAKL